MVRNDYGYSITIQTVLAGKENMLMWEKIHSEIENTNGTDSSPLLIEENKVENEQHENIVEDVPREMKYSKQIEEEKQVEEELEISIPQSNADVMPDVSTLSEGSDTQDFENIVTAFSETMVDGVRVKIHRSNDKTKRVRLHIKEGSIALFESSKIPKLFHKNRILYSYDLRDIVQLLPGLENGDFEQGVQEDCCLVLMMETTNGPKQSVSIEFRDMLERNAYAEGINHLLMQMDREKAASDSI